MTARHFHRVMITGIRGSGGSYLAEHILRHHPEVEIHGISRWHSTTQDNLAGIQHRISLHEADLTDFPAVFRAIREVKPDAVFHLAAHANVRASFETPNTVLANNILGTSNLFEALRMAEIDPYIQLCSTSEVYGLVSPAEVPIKEDAPFRPASPYAVSKVAQDLLGWSYFKSYKMKIICTRMFSYLNPRRTDLFATSFARQIARIERGLQSELVHGNLESVRTMIDIRDAMSAYWAALEKCTPGEAYNIGGKTVVSVGDVLQKLVGMAEKPVPTRCDPNLLRPTDVTLQIPNIQKFISATQWAPLFAFEDSLRELLSYWRRQVSREVD